MGVFVWALAPFVCLVCCSSWRNANLAGGFAGRPAVLCGFWFVVICLHFRTFWVLVQMIFTAYAHVRTEPECDIGHTRGKKKRANCYHNVVFDKGSMSVVETQRLRGRMQFMDGQMLADLEDAFASKD